MPFYHGPSKIYLGLDASFVVDHLSKCFTVDGTELSVFVLAEDHPYIQDPETIEFVNSHNIDLVVHPVFTHPWQFDYLNEHFLQHNIKKPWLQIAWQNGTNAKNCVNFNFWACAMTDPMYTWGMQKYENHTIHKKYLFSCLNHIAKCHRVVTLYNLFCNDLFDRSLVSLSENYNLMEGLKIESSRLASDIEEFGCFSQYHFDNFYKLLPIICPQEIHDRIPFWTHDAYTNSYVNIVTEHDFVTDFVSEKSIKPFLCEQMAIFVAGPGTVSRLRQIGLDVFDDFIDHGYDNETDPRSRLQRISDLIVKMSTFDWEKIYSITKHRRENNRNLLLSNVMIDQFSKLLQDKVQKLINL